jgi:hypothetical protein
LTNNKKMNRTRLIVFTALVVIIIILAIILSSRGKENKYLRTALNTTATQTEFNLKNEVQRNKDLAESIIKKSVMERYEAELYKELADKIYTDVLLLSSITKTKIKTIPPNSLYPVSYCLISPKDFDKYSSKTRKKLDVSSKNYLSNGITLYNVILSTPFKINEKDNFIKTIFSSMNTQKLIK